MDIILAACVAAIVVCGLITLLWDPWGWSPQIVQWLTSSKERRLYYKDYGKGPFPTGRPRKERGH